MALPGRLGCPGLCCPVAALNSATGSAGSRRRCFASMSLALPARGLGAVHAARRCPSSGPGWPPGTARRAARACCAGASRKAWACPAFTPVSCSVLSGPKRAVPSAVLLRLDHKGAGRQGEASDSDPLTVAEYVTHCPKIFVR